MKDLLDIVETALAARQFSTLAASLSAADLIDTLKSSGPFTIFAPTDEAFAKLPPQTVSELLQPENKARLKAILAYHVVARRVTTSQVIDLKSVRTVHGQALRIDTDYGVRINDANVIKADVEAANGIIHVIDSVLLPSATAIA
ncbi:MAG TPA: fasciclin domain-containing protein [Candidatus Saccharimonadales bacterium]|nr:fasciclin domain-containing protein [Candidatus Saccharimonadales bacterium]